MTLPQCIAVPSYWIRQAQHTHDSNLWATTLQKKDLFKRVSPTHLTAAQTHWKTKTKDTKKGKEKRKRKIKQVQKNSETNTPNNNSMGIRWYWYIARRKRGIKKPRAWGKMDPQRAEGGNTPKENKIYKWGKHTTNTQKTSYINRMNK